MKIAESREERHFIVFTYVLATAVMAGLVVMVFRIFTDFKEEDVFFISFWLFYLRDRDVRKGAFQLGLALAILFAIGAIIRWLWLLGS